MAGDMSSSQQYWLDNIHMLVEDTRPLFLQDQEMERCYDIESTLVRMDEGRAKELDVTRERLRALSRQAEAYKLSAQRPPNAATEKQHETALVELDKRKFGLARTIADLEQAISSAEVNLGRSKEEAAWIEKEDPVQSSEGSVADALKLAIFRNLGFVPIEESGKYNKLLIKSDTTKDVHTLAIDSRISKFEATQQAWQMAR